jgi:hypothetical protein
MDRQRVLITVKTYPTLSRKYGETVCTAGLRPDGSWLRMYPVPFRRLNEVEQYKKFDWVECRLRRHTADPRPETFRPVDFGELQAVAHMGTGQDWRERRELVLKTATVFNRLDVLIAAAKSNEASLAVFRPTEVIDFFWELDDREWDPERLREMRQRNSQLDLFDDNSWRQTFEIIPKLPFSFSYRFKDAVGKTSEMQVLDWETGALFWNCMKSAEGDEAAALEKVRNKYLDEFAQRDLHFFVGTTQQFHFVAPNPWVIVGVLPIPHERQPDLLPAPL